MKGGVGKLRERLQGKSYEQGEVAGLGTLDVASGHPGRGHHQGLGEHAPQAEQLLR